MRAVVMPTERQYASHVDHWRDRAREAERQLNEQRTRFTLVRLDDAKAVGAIFDHAREALEAAYAELERAEEHHRWHHEQSHRLMRGWRLEPPENYYDDDERLRVLMVIAEALEELPEPLTDDAESQTAELREWAKECRAKSWQLDGWAICRGPADHDGGHVWEVQ